MTDGTVLTEKLLAYAKENLELSDSDVCVKRNELLRLFNLKTTELPKVFSTPTLDSLQSEVLDYIKQNSLCAENEQKAYSAFIFGTLLPLPSFINKKFRTLREKFGAHYACDYLYNLSVKAGGISGLDFTKITTSYFKAEGAEVFTSQKGFDIKNTDGTYPKCALCEEAEGYLGTESFYGGATRSVSLDLNGMNWKMRYIEPLTRPEETLVCFSEHGKIPTSQEIVMSMFDFIEYLPDYSAEMLFSDGQNTFLKPHTYFTGGISVPKTFPQENLLSARSDLYPDVEISLNNGVVSVIRLQSFNRNTLENLVIDILEKWQEYADLSVGIFGKGIDGVCHNGSALSVEYSHDNRYSCDVILTCEKVGPDNAEEVFSVFDGMMGYPACFGRVFADESLLKATEMLSAVLTKKIPTDDSLFAPEKSLYGYRETLDLLLKEYGYFKDSQKAEAAVKRAVFDGIKNAMAKKSAFSEGDVGARALRRFLATVDIR